MSPTADSGKEADEKPASNGKLGRLIDEYGFNELGGHIEERWLADSGERSSLRELAAYVNHRLLDTAMDDAGMNPLDGEVENVYRLLTDDDVSTGTRTQARRDLERAGIDIEALEADFVSRQAVHTYLTKDRGVSYTPNTGDPVETEAATIQGFRRRLTATVESKLDRLRNIDAVTLGDPEVLVDVRVLCKDCGTQYQISELLDARACECSSDT